MKEFFLKLRFNWKSGLTVSLVAIPLSISLAVAAGASPTQGIITAIWAGLFASIFGGSNFNIVGPTGALSGILATFAFINGPDKFGLLAMAAGALILIAWMLKLERYLIYIPANTIQGFTLGVAFIIAFNNFNFAFGLSGLPPHERFIENLIESIRHVGSVSWVALITFALFLGAMFVIERLIKRFHSIPQLPPATIVAPFGMVLGYLSTAKFIPITIATLGSRYSDIAPKIFLSVSFVGGFNRTLIVTAFTVALIAILETMLSAKIADGMTKTKHDKRKEMFGLGLANIVCGFMGGIPSTAALARTALNIKSGATHRSSAFVSSVMVAVISIFFLTYFKYLPLPVIAAILTMVAIKMVEREHLERMWHVDKKSFAVAMIVATITVYEDPIIGIMVGAAISLIIFLDTLSKGQFDMVVNDDENTVSCHYHGCDIEEISEKSHTLVYSIKGHLTYVDGQAHISRFETDLGGVENVVLRLRELYFIDLDGVDAFDEIVEVLEKQDKKVYVTGTNVFSMVILRQSHHFNRLEKEGRVFPHTSVALKKLGCDLRVSHSHDHTEVLA
ncbi:MAG: SulP family inorganic anion transporter [Patescibacteria group bacterium]|jgi:SulP family sulfate permease